ncbi:helix-turn-helix domain-containing protein [Limosilactobacillus mucosae]|uniref:helix-turn-helix domain-containing protein n=1 Tax=Limosilactobacillus mucosae TaxID=97478 RepID=UPI0022E99000|nr:helix-turn-helix transcriptional regulator [Limosilactobacillus mucosae]
MDTTIFLITLVLAVIMAFGLLDILLKIRNSLESQAKKLGRDQAIKDYFLDTPRKSQSPYKLGTGGLTMWEVIEVHLMEQNMKPIELAEKAGISTGTLSDLKSGRLKNPSFKLLEKVADVLNIDMNEFRGLS